MFLRRRPRSAKRSMGLRVHPVRTSGPRSKYAQDIDQMLCQWFSQLHGNDHIAAFMHVQTRATTEIGCVKDLALGQAVIGLGHRCPFLGVIYGYDHFRSEPKPLDNHLDYPVVWPAVWPALRVHPARTSGPRLIPPGSPNSRREWPNQEGSS